MKKLGYTFLCMYLFACSPYKKVTLTMSERLTKRWQGATEESVKASVGAYKNKAASPDGYVVRYDYSYLAVAPVKKTGDFQVKASTQQSGIMTPRPDKSYGGDQRSPDDSVIKRMDFYFDKSQHVQYVMATGFPDSVYYIKRR